MSRRCIFMFLLWLSCCHIGNSRRKSLQAEQDNGKTPMIEKEFIIQMKKLLHSLPLKRQCYIIHNIASVSNSTSERVTDVLLSNNLVQGFISCKFNSTWTISSLDDISFITSAYKRHVVEIFNKIPEPFQCYVLHTIALKANGGSNRTLSVARVERVLLRLYNRHLRLGSRCSQISNEKRVRVLYSGLVDGNFARILIKDMKEWIGKFKRVVSTVYFRSFTKTRGTTKKNSSNASRDPLIPERETNIYTLPILARSDFDVRIHKITREDKNMIVHFYMLVKGNVFGTIVKSDEIVHTFQNNKIRKRISSFLGAKRVKFSLPQRNTLKTGMGRRGQTSEISTIKKLLPRRLFRYYRTFDNSGHCFILLHIAVKLQKELDHVEKLLTTMNYLPSNLLCSLLHENKPTKIDKNNESKNLFDWTKSRPRDRSSNNTDKYDEFFDDQGSPSRGPISTLEIALFVLLSVLCLAILAFLVNCVLFTIRGGKGGKRYNPRNQSVLASAVFGERETSDSNRTSTTGNTIETEGNNETNLEENKDIAESPT